MKKFSFIGVFDKTDLIIYIARMFSAMDKSVLFVDATIKQKARYLAPALNINETSYVTNFEGIEIAVGLYNESDLKKCLGLPEGAVLNYDYIFIDMDDPRVFNQFGNLGENNENFFVTSFDVYSVKKGMEMLATVQGMIHFTRIAFSKNMSSAEDEYLEYQAVEKGIKLNPEQVYFPYDIGDLTIMIENQKLQKVKLKRMSKPFKQSLKYMTQRIGGEEINPADINKTVKILEKG